MTSTRRSWRTALFLLLWTATARAQIELRVQDSDGRPVAGAAATTFEDSAAGRATSGEGGSCSLAVPLAPGSFRLRVEKPGFFHVDSQWLRQPSITVELRRGVRLEGVVLDAARKPVAKAVVELVHPRCRGCENDRVVADDDGAFSLESVPEGLQLELRASGPGLPRQKIAVGAVEPGASARRELVLESGLELRGRAVDFATGEPLAGASVVTLPDELNSATSGPDGVFVIPVLEPRADRPTEIRVSAADHCRLDVALGVGAIFPSKVLRCPLAPFAAVGGAVLDAKGEPVAGAEVFLREDPAWLARRRAAGSPAPRIPFDDLPPAWTVSSGDPRPSARTGADGRFLFERVVPWTTSILLQTQHPTAGGVQVEIGPVGPPGTAIEVVVEPQPEDPGATLRGKLTLNGEPARGAIEWRGPTRSGRIQVDPRGEFRAGGIEPGEVELAPVDVQTRSVQFGRVFDDEKAKVTVAADGEAVHDFALETKLAPLSGRVRTESGKTPARVTVSASDEAGELRAVAPLDPSGSFQVDVPFVGRKWRLVVVSGPQRFERDGLEPGGEPVEIVVPDLATFRVRFLDPGTRASVGASALMWRRKGASGMEDLNLSMQVDPADPTWYRAQIPYGEWEIGAWPPKPSHPPSEPRALVLRPGEPEPEIVFELPQGRTVELALAEGSERPALSEEGALWILESAWWALNRPEDSDDLTPRNVDLPGFAQRNRLILFDASGVARVPGLRAGRYRFVTSRRGDAIEPAEIEVRGTEGERIELRYRRAP
jgi:hypothetical protein